MLPEREGASYEDLCILHALLHTRVSLNIVLLCRLKRILLVQIFSSHRVAEANNWNFVCETCKFVEYKVD